MTDDHPVDSQQPAAPENAPTPFTAAQIRDHCRDGHRLLIQTRSRVQESVSSPLSAATYSATTFRDGDAEGVTVAMVPCDANGEPTGPSESSRVSWVDLQSHASFPADRTEISDEELTGPLGILPCRKYAVAGADGTSTFWFAVDHPGMPIRYVSRGAEVAVIAIEH